MQGGPVGPPCVQASHLYCPSPYRDTSVLSLAVLVRSFLHYESLICNVLTDTAVSFGAAGVTYITCRLRSRSGGVRGVRRKSRKTDHRSPHSDFLDDLDNDSRPSRNEPTPPVRVTALRAKLNQVSDLRRWAPAGREPAREFSGRTARISHKPKNSPLVRRGPGGKPLQSRRTVFARLENGMPRFAAAAKTVICFRRKVKREVLHALKRTRAGRGAPKKRNAWSDVQC